MLSEVEKRTGIKIPPRLLFENATIRHLTVAAAQPGAVTRSAIIPVQKERRLAPFFSLHGDSSLANRLYGLVEKMIGRKLQPTSLFEETAVSNLPAVEVDRKPAEGLSPLVNVQPAGSKPPLFFFHGDFLFGGLYLANLASHLPKDRPCYAIEPHGFDGADPPATIEEMAASRLKTVLEIQPEGPYFLGGFCNGGLVAFQVAQLLRAQHKEVACVVLLGANGMNAQYRILMRLAKFVARMRRQDDAAARELFLKWRGHSLFCGLLLRYHLKELREETGGIIRS